MSHSPNQAVKTVEHINSRMTIKEATSIVRGLGFSLSYKDGEYRLNKKGGFEGTAYYTDDLPDVIWTAKNWNRGI